MHLYISKKSSISVFKKDNIFTPEVMLNLGLVSLDIIECYCVKFENIQSDRSKISDKSSWDLVLDKILDSAERYIPEPPNQLERKSENNSEINFNNENYFFIAPRIGTRSPWSSKATDLAKLAGITGIQSIEKVKLLSFVVDNKANDTVRNNLINFLESKHAIFDPLLEEVVTDYKLLDNLFNLNPDNNTNSNTSNINTQSNNKLKSYDLSNSEHGYSLLQQLNQELNLALSEQELDYLITYCKQADHKLTDVELMMFAQANSEHCRHKIFNANWVIDNTEQAKSLFGMIKNTHQKCPDNTIKAYKDNGAIVNTFESIKLWPDQNNIYKLNNHTSHTVIKVETHNHPTAISPFPGAATGSGGEIRDEGATGRGAQPKAGLVGFTVSNLNLNNLDNPWEVHIPPPHSMQSALSIMLDGPLGAARFNNEFGRPNIVGYFRDLCVEYTDNKYYGYHKPIMLAGGLGSIHSNYTEKLDFDTDCLVIVLGGPAMLIGLGGGAASSSSSNISNSRDSKSQQLDFASVQRDNPEMQRRCQEVINHCWRDSDNPILSIHDVGAGGLSNAIPEIINDSECGADLDINQIPTDDHNMSPMELWCNEAQERYVLIISENDLDKFAAFCMRESCPYVVLGKTTKFNRNNKSKKSGKFENKLILKSNTYKDNTPLGASTEIPINLPMSVLFDNTPQVTKKINTKSVAVSHRSLFAVKNNQDFYNNLELATVCEQVLKHPTVASKEYLITIGDRTVGGLVAQDQMVGPYQVPVANCGVTLTDYEHTYGEAMAIGERTPLAIINPAAAARLAVGEAVTNILSADITQLSDIRLSANWMVASGEELEDYALYQSVYAIGEEFCPKLGLSIPVGKDSMSMRTKWQAKSEFSNTQNNIEVKSPVSLVISAFGPVQDTRKTLTPKLVIDYDAQLWFIDLADLNNSNKLSNKLSGSIFAQVNKNFFDIEYINSLKNSSGSNLLHCDSVNQSYDFISDTIDIQPELLNNFAKCIIELKKNNILLAYHDRSDGGLWATLCEMAFASQTGINIYLDFKTQQELFCKLFNEALGAVVQVNKNDLARFKDILNKYDLVNNYFKVAELNKSNNIKINDIYSVNINSLYQTWAYTSYTMQKLRDNPVAVEQHWLNLSSANKMNKLNIEYNFDIKPKNIYINTNIKPKAAILREQGTNGQLEMAASLTRAGFECVDVHMNDILFNNKNLDQFKFLAVCGGFSYGDVLGAGRGWAARILYNNLAKDIFSTFFNRNDTLTLGVCNGCQMLSQLKELIPGASLWPQFMNNFSEQFEARLSAVKINKSNSVLFQGMEGSVLPIAVSHGEGRAEFNQASDKDSLVKFNNISLQFVDAKYNIATSYPINPNGSPDGITGLCSEDGRVTIMMPHPERVFRSAQLSWCPNEWLEQDDSPWMRMFYNAYIATAS